MITSLLVVLCLPEMPLILWNMSLQKKVSSQQSTCTNSTTIACTSKEMSRNHIHQCLIEADALRMQFTEMLQKAIEMSDRAPHRRAERACQR